jgi:hypothetical protein
MPLFEGEPSDQIQRTLLGEKGLMIVRKRAGSRVCKDVRPQLERETYGWGRRLDDKDDLACLIMPKSLLEMFGGDSCKEEEDGAEGPARDGKPSRGRFEISATQTLNTEGPE